MVITLEDGLELRSVTRTNMPNPKPITVFAITVIFWGDPRLKWRGWRQVLAKRRKSSRKLCIA